MSILLQSLESSGLLKDGGWALFAALAIGAVGFGLYHYGRKQRRPAQLVAGIALMGFPYFVDGLWTMLGVAAGLVAALVLALRSGW